MEADTSNMRGSDKFFTVVGLIDEIWEDKLESGFQIMTE